MTIKESNKNDLSPSHSQAQLKNSGSNQILKSPNPRESRKTKLDLIESIQKIKEPSGSFSNYNEPQGSPHSKLREQVSLKGASKA